MKRLVTIVEGEGMGRALALVPGLVLVGRSGDADFKIDDTAVSRGHLEIRVEADGVFVKNLSSKGSILNGKRLTADVSLNPGDVLEIGHTKLRYEEMEEEVRLPEDAKHPKEEEPEEDGTRMAGTVPAGAGYAEGESDVPEGSTRAYAGEPTVFQPPEQLPGPRRPGAPGLSAAVRAALLVLCVLVVLGGGYLFLMREQAATPSSTVEYKDPGFDFSVDYPFGWSKSTEKKGVIEFGLGAEADPAWARVKIYPDHDEKHALTGLTDGFVQYEDQLKSRFAGFELAGRKLLVVNGATVMFFGFGTPAVQGKGIYMLNGSNRIVVECFSPRKCYQGYSKVFSSILQSFQLMGLRRGERQQVIDFPLPGEVEQQLALSSPTDLTRQVDQHTRQGDALVANRSVRPDNLYRAVQEYREALRLAVAGTQRLASYPIAAQGLLQATQLYNQALDQQRFEILRAKKAGDDRAAYWEANKLMQMVPDKTDPAYQEAYQVVRKLKHNNPG